MQTQVISYFCDVDDKTYYSDHAKRFIEECTRFSLPYDVVHLESQGSYQSNCLIKPSFIYSKLMEHKKPLMWLDIDTYICKPPIAFENLSTLGVNIAVASTDVNNLVRIKASPIWFNYNVDTLQFVKTWIDECQKVKAAKGNLFDHETFLHCLGKYLKEKKIAILGEEYCQWPGAYTANTVLMMGLSDMPSKKEVLKNMGYTDELIEWQSPGDSFLRVNS